MSNLKIFYAMYFKLFNILNSQELQASLCILQRNQKSGTEIKTSFSIQYPHSKIFVSNNQPFIYYTSCTHPLCTLQD